MYTVRSWFEALFDRKKKKKSSYGKTSNKVCSANTKSEEEKLPNVIKSFWEIKSIISNTIMRRSIHWGFLLGGDNLSLDHSSKAFRWSAFIRMQGRFSLIILSAHFQSSANPRATNSAHITATLRPWPVITIFHLQQTQLLYLNIEIYKKIFDAVDRIGVAWNIRNRSQLANSVLRQDHWKISNFTAKCLVNVRKTEEDKRNML